MLHKWRRLWVAIDDVSGVAARGLFSAYIHELTAQAERPKPRTLQDMEDVRVLLLRGEAGAGKSVALKQEAERLIAAGRQVAVADLTEGSRNLISLLDEKGHQPDLTIFLDGLDVGLIRDRELDVTLREAMGSLANGPCARLRLALRSGLSAELLTRCLSTHFAGDFEHLTLAPLRPEDVRTAAIAKGVDPDAFLAALEGLRVAPLSARPPTLKMLLNLWAQEGRLPKCRHHLYEEGCKALLRETPNRLNAGGGDIPDYAGHLGLRDRYTVTAWLAALMTFGNHDYLDMGAEPHGAGLNVDEIAGHVGPIPSSAARVTRRAVREVVGSALFRPVGTDGFAFAHPSFMQFLAAAFVKDHDLSLPQGIQLLCSPDGRVGANRIDTASWLGALEPAYFDHLVSEDPQVLLRAGVPAPTGEQRLRLARSLLASSASGGLDLKELSVTGDLLLVTAPGLDKLLAEELCDKSQPLARREFAALVAQDTGDVPAAACATVALDDDEPLSLRLAALRALKHDAKAAEDAILALSAVDAPEESLRLTALTLAMKDLLSPADIIRRLKPGGGHTQTYLCLHLLCKITPETLPEALDAVVALAVNDNKGRDTQPHLMVAQSLAERAFAHLDNDNVKDALAAFIATVPPREPWLRWSFPLNKRGLNSAATLKHRRDLVSAVVACAPNSVHAARNLLEACLLLRNEDLPWIVEETRSALGGPRAPVWSTLAQEVALGCGSPPCMHLRAEGLSLSEIDQIAQASLSAFLPSDYSRWTPPPSWDPFTDTFAHENEWEDGHEDDEEDEEPITRALEDWCVLATQAAAGGRANAFRVPPATLLELAHLGERRLVRDSRDLLRVVQESLQNLQRRLKGRDPIVRALWDEGKASRPKDENFLSDFIADHLRHDLVDRGVVADREVQIRARLRRTIGERTDIRIQAFTKPGTAGARQEVASLTIEVKGCWHDDLHNAMRTQLLERYMTTTNETVGLYLVGWYVCSAWSQPKIAGRAPTPKGTIVTLRKSLNDQARSISNDIVHIEAAVIDASLS